VTKASADINDTLREEGADAARARHDRAKKYAGNGSADNRPPKLYTAGALQWMKFPPLQFIVQGYLVEGLTILVGKPKRGKSWMALDWVLAIAHGGFAFGSIQCDAGDCLYMALEDSPRRLQRRIKQLLPHTEEWSPRLTLCNSMNRLDKGGLDEIRNWANSCPLPCLVVIDTFARVRPPRNKNETPYDADYRAMAMLQGLATELGLAIVVIHHQRKLDSDDPLDTASGSTGLTGAADSILVLQRDGQGTTLYGRGRDLNDIEVAMSFDKVSGRWEIMGEAQEVRRSESRSAILDVLAKATASMAPSEIAIMTGIERNTVDAQLHRMMRSGEVLSRTRGRYSHPDKV
jgi:AAA domain